MIAKECNRRIENKSLYVPSFPGHEIMEFVCLPVAMVFLLISLVLMVLG
jgi:hypothetical protein